MILRIVFLSLVALALALVFHKPLKAEPMVVAESEGLRITIYTEDCAFTDTVTNLPKRATWVEGGKTIEGCAGPFGQFGFVAFYFADKSVALVPMKMFQRVTNS